MFSKYDIEKEFKKGINIVPFKRENIKENSINLSASKYAWTMSEGNFYLEDRNKPGQPDKFESEVNTRQKCSFDKGDNCVIENKGKKYIILLPWSTTLIQTEEVLAVDNFIGGTYHSKVGMVSQGLGHIGTMLGPNFSGHSLVAVHNISNEVVKICVGETFVSVIFHRLETPLDSPNATKNGHLEKFAELGIDISKEEREFISQDWKYNINEVREEMSKDNKYQQFVKESKKRKAQNMLRYLNKRNVSIVIGGAVVIIATYYIAWRLDSNQPANHQVWIDRWWTIGGAAIFASIIERGFKCIKSS